VRRLSASSSRGISSSPSIFTARPEARKRLRDFFSSHIRNRNTRRAYMEAVRQFALADVRVEDKLGFIDKTGKMVIPPQYGSATAFSEWLAPVKLDGKWGFIDKSGKMEWCIRRD
jgi:hypothetical protein